MTKIVIFSEIDNIILALIVQIGQDVWDITNGKNAKAIYYVRRCKMSSENKQTLPLVKCAECAKAMSCPIPSKEPDYRLCFTPIKQKELWN
jgi:hypothetical protein